MDKFRKKLIKHHVEGIIHDSEQYHYFNSHKTFICDESIGWRPRADVYGIKDEIFIALDLPFMEMDKIELTANQDFIIIKGNREQFGYEKKRHYYKMEIDFGPFERVINFPVKVDIGTVKHCYKNGFYVISVKKLKTTDQEQKCQN